MARASNAMGLRYHVSRYSHRLVPIAYLILVFHSVVLIDYAMWRTPPGVMLVLLMLSGTYAALISIFGRIGAPSCRSHSLWRVPAFPAAVVEAATVSIRPG